MGKSQIKSQIPKQQKGFSKHWFRPMITIGISIFGAALLRALISPFKASPDKSELLRAYISDGKTKHLKIRSDWVVSNENEYSISTMTSRFLSNRVSFESNRQNLNRISIKSHGTWIESRNVWMESSLRFKSRLNRIAIWFRPSLP